MKSTNSPLRLNWFAPVKMRKSSDYTLSVKVPTRCSRVVSRLISFWVETYIDSCVAIRTSLAFLAGKEGTADDQTLPLLKSSLHCDRSEVDVVAEDERVSCQMKSMVHDKRYNQSIHTSSNYYHHTTYYCYNSHLYTAHLTTLSRL